MECFRNALNDTDERNKRNALPEILRMAIISQVDGYKLLHEALSEKYSEPMPVEKQSFSMISPLPSTLMQNLAGQAESTVKSEFPCPNPHCTKVYKSIKGLNGHRPSQCKAKPSEKV